jgi:hypothetical protein
LLQAQNPDSRKKLAVARRQRFAGRAQDQQKLYDNQAMRLTANG